MITAAAITSMCVNQGVIMAEKSPSSRNAKKVGKTLKEKRNDKVAKKVVKSGLLDPKK